MQSHDVTTHWPPALSLMDGEALKGVYVFANREALSFRKKSGMPKETLTCNRIWRKEHITDRNGALEILVKGSLTSLGISLRGRGKEGRGCVWGMCVCVGACQVTSVVSNSHGVAPHGLCSPRNSPGQNTEVGSLSLLQGIFPTQGLNPGLPRCRWILYQLSHQGSPRILEWVVFPFSRGSSRPRN